MLSDAEILEAVNRHSARAAAHVHQKMRRGLNSLASIVSTAPWVGLLGSLVGIVDSFHGVDGEKSTLMAALVDSLAQSLVPTALGLAVAIPTCWGYRYFSNVVETLDTEMESASLELATCLALPVCRRHHHDLR